MECKQLNTVNSNLDFIKSQATLSLFVMTLTAMVVIFSSYMSINFWAGLGSTKHASVMFGLLGLFMELAKVCAGISLIFAFVNKAKALRNISLAILLIFSAVSFIASTATISEQIKTGRTNNYNISEEFKLINYKVSAQQQVIDSLILSQKSDITGGYRTRSNLTLDKIRQEREILNDLQRSKESLKDLTPSTLVVVKTFNELISFGQDQWENIIVLILGALTEVTGLFLLYLNYALRNRFVEIESGVSQTTVVAQQQKQELPISVSDYKTITNKLVSGKLVPTQRELKKEIKLGNEKIAKIFAQWVNDGVLIKYGRAYKVAA
jgi:hypothetical protein